MNRKRFDDPVVDPWLEQACRQWGSVRSQVLGLTEPMTSAGYLGPMRCTLAAIRETPESGAQGFPQQRFPEVYVGDALLVHRAFRELRGPSKAVFHAHYAVPGPVKVKVGELHMSHRRYWERLHSARSFVRGWILCAQKTVTDEGATV